MNFGFSTAQQILFGPGRLAELPDLARENGTSALVVVGKSSERLEPVRKLLSSRGVVTNPFHVPGEPTVELVAEGAAEARYKTCDSIIAVGGGSVIDAAKAIAALVTNRRPTLDYLEVIGKGQPLQSPSLKVIAVPTTAGSGAEVTRNAVLTSTERQIKVSLRHLWMLPSVALVDPALTLTMPPSLTAATGLDALSQLIEPFVSKRANAFTDGFCREGMDRVGRALRRAFRDGADSAAREDMSMASLFGGLALANAGLGAVHGFAAPFGAMFGAPHGAVCAALLPAVMRMNMQRTSKEPGASARFEEIARRLTGNPAATALDGVEWIEALAKEMGVSGLSHHGMREEHYDGLIAKAKSASSMKANPVELSDLELKEILLRAS